MSINDLHGRERKSLTPFCGKTAVSAYPSCKSNVFAFLTALVLGFGREAEETMRTEVLWRLNLGSLNRDKVFSFSV